MNILKNVLNFAGLVVNVPVSIAHKIEINDVPTLPDLILASQPGFTITADATNVTVTRVAGGASVRIYCEHWHSYEDAEPIGGFPAFKPFIASSGSPASGAAPNGATFFGMTTGTGNAGPNDYAATVAAGAPVPFPRNGAAVGAVVSRANASSFTCAEAGVYLISWMVGIVEASQLELAKVTAGPTFTPIAETCNISGAGTQLNTNSVYVTLLAGDVIALINPAGNSTALTIQPADGSLTHAQAPNISFAFIA